MQDLCQLAKLALQDSCQDPRDPFSPQKIYMQDSGQLLRSVLGSPCMIYASLKDLKTTYI